MKTALISHAPCRAAAWFAVLLGVISLGDAMAANRIFNLYVKNETAQPVTFTISAGSCYEGTPSSGTLGPVAPGGQVMMVLARVQGHGCDGDNGEFSLKPSTRLESQGFQFSNDGALWLSDIPNGYHGKLSAKSALDESYTWTMQEVEARLSGPVDERLTKGRNYIAADSGQWGRTDAGNATSKVETLQFSTNGFLGSHYFSCSGYETFHAQHIKRLPNKNGRAYFMVAQSRAHNGYLYLIETYPGVLDPVTDRIQNTSGALGKIIWQDVYTGSFNGTINPIGNWNHPGKMALEGGVLIVAAQNWSEGNCFLQNCTHSTSNVYQRGTSEDAVVFYDVRDPAKPKYWGKMTATELQVPAFNYDNGCDGNGYGGTARQISNASLVRSTTSDEWTLLTGIYKNEGYYFRTWKTTRISPNIADWTRVVGDGSDHPQISASGEHGDDFRSYQLSSARPAPTPPRGVERNLVFDVDNTQAGGGTNDGFQFVGGGGAVHDMGLPGADRDWDSESLYVTPKGVPIVYSVEAQSAPDGHRGTNDPYILQVYDTRNFTNPELQVPTSLVVTTLADDGAGSLRNAIRHGGKVTFSNTLDGAKITLTSGPLIPYHSTVEIDASSLPNGITISGDGSDRVLLIPAGNPVVLSNLTIENGKPPASEPTGSGGGIQNHGPLTIRNCTIRGNQAESGGGIWNDGNLSVFASTISGNHARLNGGGIANSGQEGRMTLRNCTITENESDSSTGAGIASTQNIVTVYHCTVARNRNKANLAGAGFWAGGGHVTVYSSIVALNVVLPSSPSDVTGNFWSSGTNIVQAHAGGRVSGQAPLILDPLLGPLADNGGPTKTLLPQPGSPAIDAAVYFFFPNDQRGVFRPMGSAPDIGAVEVGGSFNDVTQPGDAISSTHAADRSPPNEAVANAIDNNPNTKFLNFGDGTDSAAPLTGITGFTVTPGAGASAVTGLTLTSANDAPERDPASYKLEGSNGGGAFVLIAQGPVPAFSGRLVKQTLSFANTTPYTIYKLTFPTLVNATAAIAMQIAEVELLGRIEPTLLLTDKLQLWLKADAGAVANGAGGVTSWADQSGKGNHAIQADGSKAPKLISNALNGKPVLRFDGANDYLDVADAPSISITGDISSFVVVRVDDFAGSRSIWSKSAGNLAAPTDWYLSGGTGVPKLYRGNGANFGLFEAQQAVTSGKYLILGFQMGSTTLTHYLDGLPIGSGQIAATPADGNKALKIGSRDDLGTILKGDLAELLIYDKALSRAERYTVMDYLNKRYALQLLLPANGSADLASLVPSTGTLAPGFAGESTSYTLNVAHTTTSMMFTPTAAQANATIQVDGVAVTSGTASSAIALAVGDTSVGIEVTSGTTVQTYAVTVTRAAASNNADLASLVSSAGPLAPGFLGGTVFYAMDVPNATSAMTVTPKVAEANATVKVNGATVTSGTASSAIALAVGNTSITIAVTAQDGTTEKGYFMTVTRAAASTGQLPLTQNSYRDKVTSDGPVGYWRLDETSGTVAQDSVGTRHGTYLNNVRLGLPGAPAGTTSTSVGFQSSLSQKVDIAYSAALNPAIFTVELWAKLTDSRPSVTGTPRSALDSLGLAGFSGYNFVAQVDDTWNFWAGGSTGANETIISVDGPLVQMGVWTYLAATYDGTNVRFFVNGVQAAIAPLAFTPNTTAPLRIGARSLGDDGALFLDGNVDEVAVYNKVLSAQQIAAHFAAGTQPSGTDVTQPGDVIVSTHAANRSPAGELVTNAIDNDPNTKYLNFGDGTDTAAPLTGITGFTVTPAAGSSIVTSLTLTSANDAPERDPASYKLEGSNGGAAFALIAQGPVPAFSGRLVSQAIAFSNAAPYTSYKLTFPTLVNATAANSMQIAEVELLGTIVTVAPPSSDADLAGLVPSVGTLAPGFAGGTTAYTVDVPNATSSMTVTPTAAQANATIKVNGATVISGTASSAINLAVGNNPITIAVTAQDGTTVKNYVVTVARAGAAVTEDVTRPGDTIVSSHPDNRSPATERVPNAIDNNTNTKYFNFGDGTDSAAPLTGITGFTVTPSLGASVLTGLALTSANDQPERDPASYKLEGSNDGTTFTLISQGPMGAFSGRFVRQAIAFANAAPYTSYKLTFPTVVNAATAIAMQIAEVELLGTIVTVPPSNNADLASLVPSVGTLAPGFAGVTTAYTVNVPNTTSSMTVTPTAAQANATIRVNGATVASGAASSAVTLNVGSNPITVGVTAQDGVTVKSYVITVTRAPAGSFHITDVQYLVGAPPKLRITWQSQPGAIYVLEQSADLKLWQPFGGDRPSGGATSTVDVDLVGPVSNAIFLRVRTK